MGCKLFSRKLFFSRACIAGNIALFIVTIICFTLLFWAIYKLITQEKPVYFGDDVFLKKTPMGDGGGVQIGKMDDKEMFDFIVDFLTKYHKHWKLKLPTADYFKDNPNLYDKNGEDFKNLHQNIMDIYSNESYFDDNAKSNLKFIKDNNVIHMYANLVDSEDEYDKLTVDQKYEQREMIGKIVEDWQDIYGQMQTPQGPEQKEQEEPKKEESESEEQKYQIEKALYKENIYEEGDKGLENIFKSKNEVIRQKMFYKDWDEFIKMPENELKEGFRKRAREIALENFDYVGPTEEQYKRRKELEQKEAEEKAEFEDKPIESTIGGLKQKKSKERYGDNMWSDEGLKKAFDDSPTGRIHGHTYSDFKNIQNSDKKESFAKDIRNFITEKYNYTGPTWDMINLDKPTMQLTIPIKDLPNYRENIKLTDEEKNSNEKITILINKPEQLLQKEKEKKQREFEERKAKEDIEELFLFTDEAAIEKLKKHHSNIQRKAKKLQKEGKKMKPTKLATVEQYKQMGKKGKDKVKRQLLKIDKLIEKQKEEIKKEREKRFLLRDADDLDEGDVQDFIKQNYKNFRRSGRMQKRVNPIMPIMKKDYDKLTDDKKNEIKKKIANYRKRKAQQKMYYWTNIRDSHALDFINRRGGQYVNIGLPTLVELTKMIREKDNEGIIKAKKLIAEIKNYDPIDPKHQPSQLIKEEQEQDINIRKLRLLLKQGLQKRFDLPYIGKYRDASKQTKQIYDNRIKKGMDHLRKKQITKEPEKALIRSKVRKRAKRKGITKDEWNRLKNTYAKKFENMGRTNLILPGWNEYLNEPNEDKLHFYETIYTSYLEMERKQKQQLKAPEKEVKKIVQKNKERNWKRLYDKYKKDTNIDEDEKIPSWEKYQHMINVDKIPAFQQRKIDYKYEKLLERENRELIKEIQKGQKRAKKDKTKIHKGKK